MSKKGLSTGFAWIYALISLFGIGLIYIIFNQVLTANLVPIIKDQVNQSYMNGLQGISPGIDEATKIEVNAGIDRYMKFFNALPFILFFVVIIYMIVSALRKESESQFQ